MTYQKIHIVYIAISHIDTTYYDINNYIQIIYYDIKISADYVIRYFNL